MKLLITSFGSFKDTDDNPSIHVMNHILSTENEWANDIQMLGVTLPVTYEGCVQEIDEVISDYQPDIILSFGLNIALDHTINLEGTALNGEEKYFEDVDGKTPQTRLTDKDAPQELNPAIDIEALLKLGNAPLKLSSTNTINYVCNHLYFHTLNKIRKEQSNTKAIFIHIPQNPITDICATCETVAEEIISNHR